MKHSRFGLIFLLSSGGLLACSGDPTSSITDNGPLKIVATPSVVFLDQGASGFVTVQLLDSAGTQLASDFEATVAGSPASVVFDSAFQATTNGSRVPTTARFAVTGVEPGQTTITITASGKTLDVPVSVLPLDIAATFSNAAPGVNEVLTVTLPSGYTFGPDATVVTNLDTAIVQSIAPDGASINVIVPPGSTGPLTLSGLAADFLTGVPLTLVTADEVAAVGTPVGGADPTTAPEIAVPALGSATTFFDGSAFTGADITGDGGVGAQYYKITVTEAGTYEFVTNWQGAADVDAILCADTGCAAGVAIGASADQPEDATVDLTPGTYYYSVVLFAGSPPPFVKLQVLHVVPEGGAS